MLYVLEKRFGVVLWNLEVFLGIYLKFIRFRSLLDYWKFIEMNLLFSFLWMIFERKIVIFDVRLGNGLNFFRMECDFSKFL